MFMPTIVVARLTKDYMDAPKPLGWSEPAECDELREEGHRDEL